MCRTQYWIILQSHDFKLKGNCKPLLSTFSKPALMQTFIAEPVT